MFNQLVLRLWMLAHASEHLDSGAVECTELALAAADAFGLGRPMSDATLDALCGLAYRVARQYEARENERLECRAAFC